MKIENVSYRKLTGSYYTPQKIAKYLWQYVSKSNPKKILEPSAGIGDLLISIPSSIKVDAIEIQKNAAKQIHQNTASDVHVFNQDFFQWFKENKTSKYDAVLANPPYIRHQYLSSAQKEIQTEILTNNNLKSNRLINSWVAFVIASINLLKNEGKIALVIPADILQVSYAKDLRNFLLKELSELNLITFKGIVFPDTEQKFVLLLGTKGMNETKFKHVIVEDINKMPDLNKFPTEPIPLNNDKWNELYLSRENRTFLQKNYSKMSNFNDVAKVEVGITTGANNFFSLTKEEVKNLKAKSFVRPLLGRSTLINGVFYDQATFTSSQNTNKKVWLLDLNNYNEDSLPLELNQYIYLAELKHLHHAYKLRIRNKWYQIPGIWAPQGFLSRRIGNMPKFVINKVNAVSTDTFHRIKIKDNVNINLLVIAFYSSPSLVSLELAGRVFGGGVLEILPGDFKQFKLPNINYYDDILLDHEINELNRLITTNDVIKVSEYCDNILQRKLGYKFNSIKFENILASLQSLRQNT